MNDEQESFPRPRRAVLPPLSSRTLHHPSFLPLYLAAGSAHQPMDCNSQTVPPITPSEFFYTDPSMGRGRRIPNIVSELRKFECFRLNTPPPIISTCPAPPNQPDPFKSGPHPTRNLGSPTWRTMPVVLPVPLSRVVLQLTQEEDQVITNLLKLHHQEPLQRQSGGGFVGPQEDLASGAESLVENMDMDFSLSPESTDPTSTEEMDEVLHSEGKFPWAVILGSQVQQGRLWSATELEVANTLLTRLSLSEEDPRVWSQNQLRPAETLPGHLPCPLQKGLSASVEVQPAFETMPVLSSVSFDSTQTNVGCTSFSCVGSCNRENGEPVWADSSYVHHIHHSSYEGSYVHHIHLLSLKDRLASFLPISSLPPSSLSSDSELESGPGAFGDLLGVRKGGLSESEGTAVHALLSLGDTGASDTQFLLKP